MDRQNVNEFMSQVEREFLSGTSAGADGKKSKFIDASHLSGITFVHRPLARTSSYHGGYYRAGVKIIDSKSYVFTRNKFEMFYDSFTSALLTDPNALVAWEEIVSVKHFKELEFRCSICLESTLVIPRITPCGHVFCFTCLVAYSISKGSQEIPCPMCSTTITIHNVKPVQLYNDINNQAIMEHNAKIKREFNARIQDPKKQRASSHIRDDLLKPMTFMLVSKEVSSIQCLPSSYRSDGAIPSEHWDKDALLFSKWIVVSPDTMRKRMQVELNALRKIIGKMKAETDRDLIVEKAMQTVYEILSKDQYSKLKNESLDILNLVPQKIELAATDLASAHYTGNFDKALWEWHAAALENTDIDPNFQIPNFQNECIGIYSESATKKATSTKSIVTPTLFYQEIDGKPIYLDSLDQSMLFYEYSSQKMPFPSTVAFLVERMDYLIIYPESISRRYQHLSHLQLGTQIHLCQLNLQKSFSFRTLQAFSKPIKKSGRDKKPEIKNVPLIEEPEVRTKPHWPALPGASALLDHLNVIQGRPNAPTNLNDVEQFPEL